MAVLEHPLVFKVPAQTSRDTLRNKPTWFLVAEDDQGRVGVGECSLILGLSPETENVARTMLHDIAAKGVLDAMAVPASCPAVRFAVETAAWDLAQGGTGTLATSAFSEGARGIDINGLVWMGDAESMRTQFDSLVQRGFTTLKCKVGALDWEQEHEVLRAFRDRCPAQTSP